MSDRKDLPSLSRYSTVGKMEPVNILWEKSIYPWERKHRKTRWVSGTEKSYNFHLLYSIDYILTPCGEIAKRTGY